MNLLLDVYSYILIPDEKNKVKKFTSGVKFAVDETIYKIKEKHSTFLEISINDEYNEFAGCHVFKQLGFNGYVIHNNESLNESGSIDFNKIEGNGKIYTSQYSALNCNKSQKHVCLYL